MKFTRHEYFVDAQQIIGVINLVALVVIMFATGLRVEISAVAASARSTGRVALAVCANYVVVPALTVGLLLLFQPAPLVAVGFLILAACPGAPVGPPAAELARADVPWSIGLMVILGGLSAVLSPSLLNLLVPWVTPGSGVAVDFLLIVRTLIVAQLLPLAVGLGTRRYAPTLTERVARPFAVLANILLLVLIGLILAAQYETLALIRIRAWVGMTALFVGSLAAGWFFAAGSVATRRTSALTAAARNAAVGLAIATGSFGGTPVVTAVVAYGLFTMIGTLACAAAIGKIGRRRSSLAVLHTASQSS